MFRVACVCRLSNLRDMETLGLFMHDLNMYDCSRWMVMAGWQHASRIECSIEKVSLLLPIFFHLLSLRLECIIIIIVIIIIFLILFLFFYFLVYYYYCYCYCYCCCCCCCFCCCC